MLDDAHTVSVEEAKRYGAQLESVEFQPPKRSIDDVIEQLGGYSSPPPDCAEKQAALRDLIRKQTRASKTSLERDISPQWGVSWFVEHEIALGNYWNAERLAEMTIPTAAKTSWYIYPVLWTQLARARAAMGDVSGAKSAFGSSKTAWIRTAQSERGRSPFYKATARAAIAKARGSWRESEQYYRFAAGQPIAFSEGIEPVTLQAELAYVLMRQGRLVEAEVAAREGIRVGLWRPGYGAKTARVTTRLAEILYEQGRIDDAERLVGYALNMDEVDCVPLDSVGHAYTLQLQASLLAERGDWSGVREQLVRIETRLSERPDIVERMFADNPDWALALIDVGQSEEAIERLDTALDRARDQFSEDSDEYAIRLGYRALAKSAAGDEKGAAVDFSDAIERLIWKPSGTRGGASSLRGDSRRRRVIEGYIRFLQAELALRANESTHDLIAEMFRAQTAMSEGPVDRALRASALRVAATATDPELADLVNREQRVTERIDANVAILADMNMTPDEQRDDKVIGHLEEEVRNLRLARATLFEEIEEKYPEFSAFVNPKPMTIEEVRSLLRAGETLVLIHTYPDRTLVWGIPRRGTVAFATIPVSRDELTGLVHEVRRSFDVSGKTLDDVSRFDVVAARRLYERLLEPIRTSWNDAEVLVEVANHPLSTLPLWLLPTTDRQPPADQDLLFDGYRSVDWLIRTHSVVSLPSPGSLRVLRTSPPSEATRRPFLGFGNPVFRPPSEGGSTQISSSEVKTAFRSRPDTRSASSAELADLPALPETADELLGIASALGADLSKDVYLQAAANEVNLTRLSSSGDLSSYAVIDFATHGLVEGDLDGLRQPALALSHPLAAGVEGDGLLTMTEILGLRANADWIVLSACNTAAAQGKGADAVSGLGRSFLYAGGRRLLVSNWAVHSEATKNLMIDLFKRQSTDTEMSSALAYRQTLLYMIEHGAYRDASGEQVFSYAHPIFWAPFSLVGDGS